MTIASELASAALVGALYAALFIAMELWGRRSGVAREITRKGVHVGGGLIALALPSLFASHWTVLALGSLLTLVLIVTRRRELLQSVQGVARVTYGEVLYPAAIYLTLVLSTSAERPRYYVIAILALAFADGLAGVVGERWGRRAFIVARSRKSVEGSATFAAVCFAITTVGLLAAGDAPPHALAAAGLVALAVTVLEAMSTHGVDNVTVPLGVFGMLMLAEDLSAATLSIAIGAVILLLGPVLRSVSAPPARGDDGSHGGHGVVHGEHGAKKAEVMR